MFVFLSKSYYILNIIDILSKEFLKNFMNLINYSDKPLLKEKNSCTWLLSLDYFIIGSLFWIDGEISSWILLSKCVIEISVFSRFIDMTTEKPKVF